VSTEPQQEMLPLIRRRGGRDVIEGRDTLHLLSTTEKLEKLQLIESQLLAKLSTLTEGCRTWVGKSLKPVLKCYRDHFNSDADLFAAKFSDKFCIAGHKSRCAVGCNKE
jgi:hypothetical protein